MASPSPLLNVRMPASERHVYRQIAAETGETLTDFVREALAREAVRRLASKLTDQDTANKVRQLLEEATPA